MECNLRRCEYYQGFKPCGRKNTSRCPFNKSIPAKAKEILDFFKEAFCVDGKVEFSEKRIEVNQCVKVTDSKRGVFYIAIVPETDMQLKKKSTKNKKNHTD